MRPPDTPTRPPGSPTRPPYTPTRPPDTPTRPPGPDWVGARDASQPMPQKTTCNLMDRHVDSSIAEYCDTAFQTSKIKEDYVQSAAGVAETGDLLFPTDSISCGDARWTKSETTTPYFMSPPLGNDDIDLLSDLGHGSLFENDPIIPFTDQSKFSLPSSQRSQDSLTLAFGNTHNPAALQSFGTSIEGWSFRGQAFGDRFYQTSIETNPLPGLFQPAEEPTMTTPKVLDLGYSYIESAVGQHLEQEKSDLIIKIANGYNIQTISEQSVAGGIEALRQGLAASGQSRGERSGLSAQEIQRLLVRGKPGDPSTSKGHIIEPLTDQHLQMALTRYGQQRNMYYRLGVVRSTRSSLHFQLSMLPNSPPKESQIIIWVYQEPIDYDMSTGQYNYSRWAAITSSNVPGKTASYAQVLQSATPKIRELEKPVNPQLLHDGRRRSVSAPQSELLPATTASAIATKCCGKVWPTKTALK
ncbi:hypothetical protein E2P81_ATG03335 [Venturia nashicola]|nr:hypothetical protein E2P81_ATG03335 [Venturia nashicola]